ncbi:MAG: tRNA (guanosine(46)-N7)-methyltransferase TrmB [Ruminococcus sp.]|nr:tRNA (guanosine(46)-N7)-methyltransferase TrmB [Ruminococcus sp.]MBQ1815832.1 tRNA (guanosine(46)-N7)-methyltransferase TrmB [Ruminococcus sp.]MEE0674943.1 tRNA (guanosine(46)-N7)-methyltransferase TrmB [Ruminococcus sp.]MEE0857303.1 tRNA (guanosine(46)-N7)-methyltransferase TrmB [Ruminococcus sp.]MEE1173803.1 tRNA (guanosine(46)-N7)-methyltransferase TrmB [Ruminococcus sp.]
MRIRKKKWAEPELAVCDFFVKNPEEYAGKWKTAFKKEQPLYLEIGCGKGGFAGQFALKNPDINIIALDIKLDMLGVGRRTIVRLFEENGKTQDDISNILLVKYNVEQLDNIIKPEDSIERLFINFCNPWPRERHKKRRLTYYKKLEMYKSFLKKDAEIRFKTDDDGLFDESLEYFEQSGYEIKYLTRDLHASGVEDNIVTEHEKMFSDEGIKIKYLIAVQKPE